MKRKEKYYLTNIYIPIILVTLLFLILIFGILTKNFDEEAKQNEYLNTTIDGIPNSALYAEDYSYEIYFVQEKQTLYELALKLNTNEYILAYNNPFLLQDKFISSGTRIVLYHDNIIFYEIQPSDTLESIAQKFSVSENQILLKNKDIQNYGFENKKYLIIQNPIITNDILSEKKDPKYFVSTNEILEHQEIMIEKEKSIIPEENNRSTMDEKIMTKQNTKTKKISKPVNNNKTKTEINNNNIQTKKQIKDKIKTTNTKENVIQLNLGNHLYWPVESSQITSPFGTRKHPILKQIKKHNGIDIAAPKGMRVDASVEGIVTYSGKKGGYGNLVEIKRKDGLILRYAHLSIITVSTNEKVKEGQKIGEIGKTGLSTGYHLHFEIEFNKQFLDPMKFYYH